MVEPYCNCGHTEGSHLNGHKCLGCIDDWDDTGDPFVSDNINPMHRFEEAQQSFYERSLDTMVKGGEHNVG